MNLTSLIIGYGFILADGSIKNNNKLIISVSEKDHLEKFANYVKCNIRSFFRQGKGTFPNGIKQKDRWIYECSLQSVEYVSQFANKFNIKHNKTYNPPSIEVFKKMTDNQFLAMFCGYVDGDGTINSINLQKNEMALEIRCHSSWFNINQYMGDRISNIFNKINPIKTYVNKAGYCSLKISDNYILGLIKKQAIEMKLPLMERKWNKINENYYGRIQQGQTLRNQIIPLWLSSKTKSQIAKILSLEWYTVRNTIKLWERDVKRVILGEKPANLAFTDEAILTIIKEKKLIKER